MEGVAINHTENRLESTMFLMERKEPIIPEHTQAVEGYRELISNHCREIVTVQKQPSNRKTVFEPSSPASPDSPGSIESPGIGFQGTLKQQITALRQMAERKPNATVRRLTIKPKFLTSLLKKINKQDVFAKFEAEQNRLYGKDTIEASLMDACQFQLLQKEISNRPRVGGEQNEQNPKHKYFTSCQKGADKVLDIFTDQLRNGQLQLQHYRLMLSQCQGLLKACELDRELISSLMMDSCGLDDESLTTLLEGLLTQKQIKHIVLRN